MRHITIAAASLAALAFAGTAYADSYYGPRRNGDQCWRHQFGNSLAYWEQCKPEATKAAPTDSE